VGEKRMPAFSGGQLEAICRVLADTNSGLTGSEIGHILYAKGISDPSPEMTKWKRLYSALVERQNLDKHGNCVFAFIARALEPARNLGRGELYHAMLGDLNVTLSYLGYKFCEDGKFHTCKQTNTFTEAESRAKRMYELLVQRGTHPDVLTYCRAELLQDDCFHAVLEVCKSVAVKIRERTGLDSDGASLIRDVFGGTSPILRINGLQSETEKGEQRGFVNLATGLFGTFRNPTAHEAKIIWPLSEVDALDFFLSHHMFTEESTVQLWFKTISSAKLHISLGED